ncbi:MAG: hypothetical protein EPO32_09650 [Anaerolineae bacterium]|nr:MAG: hypothetical protein EPO32_09650 [Anaerolineae bacterium]
MKRFFSVLSVALILLVVGARAGISHAQSGDADWSDPWSVFFGSHPQIIQSVFGNFGIAPNSGTTGYSWTGSDPLACETYPTGDPNDVIWYESHTQYMFFLAGANSIEYAVTYDMVTLLAAETYQVAGLEVHSFLYTYEDYPQTKIQVAYVQLIPGFEDEVYGWSITETCTETKGDNMPDVDDVMAFFIQTIRNYGYGAPADIVTPSGPTPTPFVYVAPEIEEFPAEEFGEALPEDEPVIEPLSTEEQAALVGAAVLGAVVGTAVVQGGANMMRKTLQPALVPSPVDGKLVTPKQAAFEQGKLDQGWRYNPVSGGFDYVPEAEKKFELKSNIVAGQVAQVHAQADQRKAAIQQKVQASRQKYTDSVRAEMDRHQQSYQQHMQTAERNDRYSSVAGLVETAADIGVDALAECTGPVGKSVKYTYGRVKDAIQYANDVYDHGFVAGSAKFAASKAYEAGRNKGLSKVPKPKFGSGKDTVRYFNVGPNTLAREVTPRVVDAMGNSAVDKGAELLVDAGKDAALETKPAKNVIRKINTVLGGR